MSIRLTIAFLLTGLSLAYGDVVAVDGSAVSTPPLPPPSLPENPVGWADFFFKLLPALWGVFAPFVTDIIVRKAPGVMSRVPRPVLAILSSVIGILGGVLSGYASQSALDGLGGVSPSVGGVEAAMTAAAAHKVKQTPPIPAASTLEKQADA
jgi:hypothetical protein